MKSERKSGLFRLLGQSWKELSKPTMKEEFGGTFRNMLFIIICTAAVSGFDILCTELLKLLLK